MTKMIVANWKMCGSPESAKIWAEAFMPDFISADIPAKIIICPPSPLITSLKLLLGDSGISLGGQDCHFEAEGAYTGETSASLLRAIGCEYVLVGHSERRSYCKETNEIVSKKATRAIIHGLIPIICIGETAEERESGNTLQTVYEQLAGSIPPEARAGNFIVAYEPVWAIGSGKVPTIEEIQQVHRAILNNISKVMAIDITNISVLYGGSVKSDNAKEILSLPEVSGVLVGGASLKADEFFKIAASV